jgi:hypothetical protein
MDKKGNKLALTDANWEENACQKYFDDAADYKNYYRNLDITGVVVQIKSADEKKKAPKKLVDSEDETDFDSEIRQQESEGFKLSLGYIDKSLFTGKNAK